MKLIINADDFGMTQSINEAIIELLNLRSINSTSVMINMPYAEEVVKLLDIKDIRIGWHINLTEGQPISKPSHIPTLVNENNCFYSLKELSQRIKNKQTSYKDIITEMNTQFNMLKKIIGDGLQHIDAHQSVLSIPLVYKALINLVTEQNIKTYMRVNSKFFLIKQDSHMKIIKPNITNTKHVGLKRVLKEYYFQLITRKRRKHFYTYDGTLFNQNLNVVSLLNDIKEMKVVPKSNKVFEVSCHPSKDISELTNTKLLQQRVDEYNVLSSSEFQNNIKRLNLLF